MLPASPFHHTSKRCTLEILRTRIEWWGGSSGDRVNKSFSNIDINPGLRLLEDMRCEGMVEVDHPSCTLHS